MGYDDAKNKNALAIGTEECTESADGRHYITSSMEKLESEDFRKALIEMGEAMMKVKLPEPPIKIHEGLYQFDGIPQIKRDELLEGRWTHQVKFAMGGMIKKENKPEDWYTITPKGANPENHEESPVYP